jgi:DNA polymerase III epsilon subunit-like protein
MGRPTLHYLYGNVIAAIDVETTGTLAGYHDLIQIAIVPLDAKLHPSGSPFCSYVRPEHPERADPSALQINHLDLETLQDAPTQERVVDLLQEWFDELDLPVDKRLIPLAHRWTFENSFLTAWLGTAGLEHFFHIHPRDAMILALAFKDKCGLLGLPMPFESVSLTNLCRVYGITNTKPHDALADAIAEAELYRKLLGS